MTGSEGAATIARGEELLPGLNVDTGPALGLFVSALGGIVAAVGGFLAVRESTG